MLPLSHKHSGLVLAALTAPLAWMGWEVLPLAGLSVFLLLFSYEWFGSRQLAPLERLALYPLGVLGSVVQLVGAITAALQRSITGRVRLQY